MSYLADVNFLIALLYADHKHSPLVVEWLESHDELASIQLCRVAQMGVLRILTNPGAMKDNVQSAAAVWRAWDLLLADDRFLLVEEPQRLEETWRGLTRGFPVGRWAETDTYFAAFAIAGGQRLLTLDQRIHFPGLEVERIGTP